ncbi:hypothetical protein SLEP1_g774 [Rubroshorea leprosula]|uniref:Leucine-rich repeat-containing N-terminal plant-type domain-containing protein n=1 Tax=Rubroshorea leprosula TaxID=152421 RepID=A0AAV5HL35_9ROSI|nr:hypothetical protein SLEP1_g774 [Rubroshorea leprosula]
MEEQHLFSPHSLNAWSTNNTGNLCHWTSITCDSFTGMISETNLSCANITGSLAQLNFTTFSTPTALTSINSVVGSIPAAIGRLSKLTLLDLSNNGLVDVVPMEIGQLTELQYLSLFNNSLNGSIPYETSHLQKRLLWLKSKLSNLLQFPTSWCTPIQVVLRLIKICKILQIPYILRLMRFWHSPHCGEMYLGFIQSYILDLGNVFSYRSMALAYFCLSHADIFRNAFGVHLELLTIFLNDNQFTGEISPQWGECQNLINLQMDRNKISGQIPAKLGKLNKLSILSLSSNDLSGNIPDELGNLSMLINLNLSKNHLTGEIPQDIGDLHNLAYLDLTENNLNGSIPEQVGNCKSPIPTGRQFQNASGEALVGNSGFYGNVDGLTPCSSSSKKSSKMNTQLLIFILAPICAFLALTSIAVMILMLRAHNKLRDEK